jgi:BirA family biotin operon repressor/biotin-[acetyl-CoA-carboxylase] ligase
MDSDISPASILQNITTTFVGRDILYHYAVPSTMETAKEAAGRGAQEGTIILAEEQTAGRGRLGRSWLSPRGGISLSIILRPNIKQLPQLIMIASLAVSRSIEKTCGIKADIKWPNDILIRDRKVCGILVESAIRGQTVDWAIIGIGLNVNLNPADFPDIAAIATSLSTELGRKVSRLDIITHLLSEIELLYTASRRGKPIYKEWRSRLETLGRKVRIEYEGIFEEGQAEDVDDDGSLLLRRSDGSLATITTGEVTILK